MNNGAAAPDLAAFASVKLESAPCPLGCESNDTVYLTARDRIHDLPGEFTIVRCRSCGLLRTNPRPSPESVGLYYPDDYAPYHGVAPPPPAPAPARQKPMNWERRFRAWRKRKLGLEDKKKLPLAPPGRLLEIGCANGGYLAEAAALGWQVDGVEFNRKAAEAARARGFDVFCGPIEAKAEPAEPYDVIVGWMVFEHLHDPAAIFLRLRRWVRREGWLVMSVPDASALELKVFGERWYALHVPAHMTHFTPRTLRGLLLRTGWQVRHIIWHQNPNNLFNSLKYWARDRHYSRLEKWCEEVVAGRAAQGLHRFLAKWLAVFRQSGRMTVWAQRIEGAAP